MPRSKRPTYVSVRNFERFQHYKHRNPPWIKLYTAILDDPAFVGLDEVQQCRVIKMFLIAGMQNNRILFEPNYIGKLMRLPYEVDLSPLIAARFVLAPRMHNASTASSRTRQNAMSETETPNLPFPKKEKEDSSLVHDASTALAGNGQPSEATPQKARAIPTLFPVDFKPNERGKGLAESYGFNAFREAAACIDHHNGIGNKFLDHQAAFRTWIRKKREFSQPGRSR